MAQVGGLGGGPVNTNTGSIRPPVGDGQAVTRPGQRPTIPNGSIVEGLVTGKTGEIYQVRIGNQTLNASSTLSLFVGQRFRAMWDGSTNPPTLKLQPSDVAMLSRFTGREQQVALALLTRGLPLNDDALLSLKQQWLQQGGDPAKLGVMAELWARGVSMGEGNVNMLAWYMELSPQMAMYIWKKIRDRLHSQKYNSPREMLDALKNQDDPEVKRFLAAHALAGRPARQGLDPAMLLAPAWWPVDEDESAPVMARVAISKDEMGDRQVWWISFNLEGNELGPIMGDAMTNGRAISANIRLQREESVQVVTDSLPELQEDLEELSLPVQHLGVGRWTQEERNDVTRRGLDMEA